MERAVIRMYFEDNTFKTFLLLPNTTVDALCAQVKIKQQTSKDFSLCARVGTEDSTLPPADLPWKLYKQHGDNVRFVFKEKTGNNAPSNTSTYASRPSSSAVPPKPSSSSSNLDLGGFDKLSINDSRRKPTGPSVTEDDFDALLNQLQFDVGGGGGGGSSGGRGSSNTSDPFAGLGFASATPCSACGQPVTSNSMIAFGLTWHKEHLACAICKRNFLENDVPVVEGSDGKAYCQPDYLNKFAPKCARCTTPIQGECTNALGKQWHPACFVCRVCEKPFPGTFFEHEGHPYCERHYYDEKGLICPECDRPIIGKCVRARGKRFHPQHFVCTHCKGKLSGNEYFYHDSKLYCKSCSTIFYG